MAVNNHVNQVIVNGEPIIDLTEDTVEATDVLEGKTFHSKSGEPTTGTLSAVTDMGTGTRIGYLTEKKSSKINEVSPYYGIGTKAGRLPLEIGSTSENNINELTIYGNNEPGKNLLEITTNSTESNGITFTVDKKAGTITANGTAKGQAEVNIILSTDITYGDLYLSGCPNGGSYSTYIVYAWDMTTSAMCKKWDGKTDSIVNLNDKDSEVKIVRGNKTRITVRIYSGVTVNNLVFRPMLRKSEDNDPAFEPFHLGVGQRTRNLFEITLNDGSATGISHTIDKTAGTITLNGTASDIIYRNISISNNIHGNFYFSGCPNGGSTTTYYLYPWDLTTGSRCKRWDGTTGSLNDIGQGNCEVQLVEGHRNVLVICIAPNTTVNNLVFKPMLRKSEDNDLSFEPYGYKIQIQNGSKESKNLININNIDPRECVITHLDKTLYRIAAKSNPGRQTTHVKFNGVQFEDGKTYTITLRNNMITTYGDFAIRNNITGKLANEQSHVWLNKIGELSFSYIHDENANPDGVYASLIVNRGTTAEGEVDVSEIRMVEGETILPFVPYGHPASTVYLGPEPLTSGKTAMVADLNLPMAIGKNILDTPNQNKPYVTVKHDQEIENFVDSRIANVNTDISNALGYEASVNLFPIDKGTSDVDVTYGPFMLNQDYDESNIAFMGDLLKESDTAPYEYPAFFNRGYRFENDSRIWGDLSPGWYILTLRPWFDDEDTADMNFIGNGEIYQEIYEMSPEDSVIYGTKIATCPLKGSVLFEVTKEKPLITILTLVKPLAGKVLNDSGFAIAPFLRKLTYSDYKMDKYKPSVNKRLAKLEQQTNNSGPVGQSYNETQYIHINDEVTEE